MKPRRPRTNFKNFPNNSADAKAQGKTFYLDAENRCTGCGQIGKWANSRICMHCFDFNENLR